MADRPLGNPGEVDPSAIPSRRIVDTKPVELPSGQVFTFYLIEETHFIPPGVFDTHRHLGVTPPLACRCQPLSLSDITECTQCQAAVCLGHAATCFQCGRVFCTACLAVDEMGLLPICQDCASDLKTPKTIKMLKRLIWG